MEQAISGLEHVIRQRAALEAKREDRGSERDFWLRAEREITAETAPGDYAGSTEVKETSGRSYLRHFSSLRASFKHHLRGTLVTSAHYCGVSSPRFSLPLLVLHLIATQKQ